MTLANEIIIRETKHQRKKKTEQVDDRRNYRDDEKATTNNAKNWKSLPNPKQKLKTNAGKLIRNRSMKSAWKYKG